MKTPTLFLRLIIGDISVTQPYKEDRWGAHTITTSPFESVALGTPACVCRIAV